MPRMSSVTVKFIGGELDGEVRELESTRPLTITKLTDPQIQHDEEKLYLPVEYKELQYWMVPRRDGTLMAFEKPVWDEIQAMLAEHETRERNLKRRVHDALDRVIGW